MISYLEKIVESCRKIVAIIFDFAGFKSRSVAKGRVANVTRSFDAGTFKQDRSKLAGGGRRALTWMMVWLLLLLIYPYKMAHAVVSIGLSGLGSDTKYGLEKRTSARGTASLSLSLGPFISVGLSGSRAQDRSEGSQLIDDQYYQVDNRLLEVKYDVRSTLILYRGLVSPFLFGGVANRYVRVQNTFVGKDIQIIQNYDDIGAPTYGFGIAINLSQSFSLKITQTYTRVESKFLVPDASKSSGFREDPKKTIDSYTQIGINYNLF